ncbi:alpha/beta hydrolase [Lacticaseibacillus manihotivorans]|uniref:alpha/beta hydrolase n=1 Tax=Lacticaseibacillus manihotivorans TaxID=88233 RepID=UPI000AE4BD77|nr:alpha/beta hydrolase [Lacticaseibacillus manihotivorans]
MGYQRQRDHRQSQPLRQVKFAGHWRASAKQRLVKVVFANNRTRNYDTIATWLHTVLLGLQQNYNVRQFNVVAHSLGNAA